MSHILPRDTIAQSICTHYIGLSLAWFILGSGKNIWVENNRVIVIQKEKKQPALFFSFWMKVTLFICTLLFATLFWTLFFEGSQTDPCFQTKNSCCRLTGRMWCQFVRCCGYIFVVKAYTALHSRKERIYSTSQGCIKIESIKMWISIDADSYLFRLFSHWCWVSVCHQFYLNCKGTALDTFLLFKIWQS